MTRLRSFAAVAAAVALIGTAATSSLAAPAPETTPALVLPAGDAVASDFDSRLDARRLAPTAAQKSAVAALRGARVTWNPTLGTPRSLAVAGGALSAPRTGDPLVIARGWLAAHRAAFGLSAIQVSQLQVIRNHTLPGVHARVVSFVQSFGGLAPEYGGVLTVLVDRDGRVVSYSGNPVRSTRLIGGFQHSAADAVTRVVAQLAPGVDFAAVPTGKTQAGYQLYAAGPFLDVVRVKKMAFPTAAGARAAYVVLLVKSFNDAWAVVVDGATGTPLLQRSLVAHSEGTVYENYPGAAKGGTPVVKNFGPNPQSPGGWVDPTGMTGLPGVTTVGNNANTAAAWTAPIAPLDQYNRPVSPTSEFNYPFSNAWAETEGDPTSIPTDRDSAVVNLFYHHNRIHDEFYKFGFTETGGNFQLNNFDKGGHARRPGFGSAQSGAIGGGEPDQPRPRQRQLPDPRPTASRAWTAMFLWEPIDDAFEGPYRDGDFDATIIQHEYSHGLSNRYVGGGGLGSLGSVQAGSMGEGWGDWYAMNDLFAPGSDPASPSTAPYVGTPARGIRNWNYASTRRPTATSATT